MERKGKYEYSQEELDRNKVLKMQQDELAELENHSETLMSEVEKTNKKAASQKNKLDKLTEELEELRKKALSMAKKTGVDSSKILNPIVSREKPCCTDDAPFLVDEKIPLSDIPSWNELVEKANDRYEDNIVLEDLLSAEDFQYCIEDIDRIKNEFSKKTKLNKVDIAFLMIATALQTARWIIIQKLMGELGDDKSERISSDAGDKRKKKDNEKWNKKHDNREHVNSDKYPNWKEILFGIYKREDGGKTNPGKCPYDAQEGGPWGFDDGGKGMHRQNTLGHDPILGWIFGTANIMTCTITCSRRFNYGTYRVIYPGARFGERILAAIMFQEVIESIKEDKFRLPAALFAQYAHLKSDVFTERGLPIPLIDTFSPDLAGKLYSEQYDSLCLVKDIARIGAQAGFSILINMIISVIHGFFYDPNEDFRRDFYEVRTRKILLYSNAIATSINLGYVGVNAYTGNVGEALKKLDLGGLLVTLWRLFSDIRFITRVKEQFLKEELDKVTAKELDDLDNMFEKQ